MEVIYIVIEELKEISPNLYVKEKTIAPKGFMSRIDATRECERLRRNRNSLTKIYLSTLVIEEVNNHGND